MLRRSSLPTLMFLVASSLCGARARAEDEGTWAQVTAHPPATRAVTRAALTPATFQFDGERPAYVFERPGQPPCVLPVDRTAEETSLVPAAGKAPALPLLRFELGGSGGQTRVLALVDPARCEGVALTLQQSYDPTRPLPVLGSDFTALFAGEGGRMFTLQTAPAALARLVRTLGELKYDYGYYTARDVRAMGRDHRPLAPYLWSRDNVPAQPGFTMARHELPASGPFCELGEQVAELGALAFCKDHKGALWARDRERQVDFVVWSPRDVASHELSAFAVHESLLRFRWTVTTGEVTRRKAVSIDTRSWHVGLRPARLR